ncbi:hypothetical protein N6B72_07990 [Chryseobacterium soli]|uniref:hypothetical protein n=1 Tax=Chryseobacterium soli TaxID=445961 RepID=UPI002954D314|nr:hypothetical protein [Chryseobacterium soli]MDV7696857.1 hypothetical protein [Chryseobacterium soli]
MGTLIQNCNLKKYVFLLLLLFYSTAYSCECSPLSNIFNVYSKSDLVADITIINIHPSTNKNLGEKFYMVDVKYNTIYKGKKVESFYVSGSKVIGKKRYGLNTSCSLGLEKGDRLIIFHSLDKIQLLHYCTPRINEKDQTKFLESKKILESLSHSPIQTNYKNFIVDTKFNSETGKNDLNQFDGIKAKNSFALIEITLNKDGSFKNAEYLKKLDSQYDQEILDFFRASKLLHQDKFKFSEGETFILPIHYIKEKNNKTSITPYFY